MKLLLAFVVVFVSMVDVRAVDLSCAVCTSSTICATAPTIVAKSFSSGTTDAAACRTIVTLDTVTTNVVAARDGVADCTTTANIPTTTANLALFASGTAASYAIVVCGTTPNFNNAVYAAKSLGCYSCTDATGAAAACLTPATSSGVKVFDVTLAETGKVCSTVLTYAGGKLTNVVRARVNTADCVAADGSTTGDGIKTTCCFDKGLCNDVAAPTTVPWITTSKPGTTAAAGGAAGAAKHAPKNIINAFVLISAVILAVVSK